MRFSSVRLFLSAAGVLLGIITALAVPCRAQHMRTAYIRMDVADRQEFREAIQLCEKRGAVLRHRIYPYAAIGQVPDGAEAWLEALPGVRDVIAGQVLSKYMEDMSTHEMYLAKAYNGLHFPRQNAAMEADSSEPEFVEPIDPSPLRIPRRCVDEIKAASAARGAPVSFPSPTSEFMMGHVAMAVVMPESDPGRGDHDWVESEEEILTEEVICAMDWWARHTPEQNLKITYEINYRVPVNFEPMSKGGWALEDRWVGQTLANLGYNGVNHFYQSYLYIDDMRHNYGADWGFISYILHGFKGQNFGGFLAYAYLGGPLNANIYSNGSLGPEKLDRVMAHEIGHNFYALDEYPNDWNDCSSRSGYLNVENANQQYGGSTCKLHKPCIMRGAGSDVELVQLHPCYYTEGQVGWWDTDGDGIPDILDTDPIVESLGAEVQGDVEMAPGDTLYGSGALFRGKALAVPLQNKNSRSEWPLQDITIEPVAAEYRVDGGPWMLCDPVDEKFDGPSEEFSFAVTGLSSWEMHTVEARARTAHGNVTPDSVVSSLRFFLIPDPSRTAVVRLATSNPARPPVAISFAPAHSSGAVGVLVSVEVAIYDAMGRKIKTVELGDFESGRYYSTEWDGTDDAGVTVPAGVYMIGMSSQGRLCADKVLVIP